jgi:uncharacterized protein with PQ loop repeat
MNLDIQLQILGYTAGVLIIISFIPQLVTIIQNKTAHNVSFGMYTISLISQILWITYGLLKWDMAVLATNLGTSIITILIIGFSLYYKYTNDKINNDKPLEMISIRQI